MIEEAELLGMTFFVAAHGALTSFSFWYGHKCEGHVWRTRLWLTLLIGNAVGAVWFGFRFFSAVLA